MTGDLLQSDIDLARQLIAAGESDAQIIVALGYRKIALVKAQRLVRDLRSGIDVQPEPGPASLGSRHLSSATDPSHLQDATTPDFKPASDAPDAKGVESTPWFRFVFLAAIGICIAAVFLVSPKPRKLPASTPTHSRPEPETVQSAHVPKIEIDTDSLRVSGVPLARENAFATLSQLFGAPSRTNQLPEFTIYAFDREGIVLYSQSHAGKDSLLLYFEPVGGASGAQKPFHGTLAVQGYAITSNSLATNLAAITQLALSETVSNIFSGRCGKLDISFAYLKSGDRLSLVQIDLD